MPQSNTNRKQLSRIHYHAVSVVVNTTELFRCGSEHRFEQFPLSILISFCHKYY